MSRLRPAAPVLAALSLGLLAAWPLLANAGFLLTRGGGDSPFLLLRLHQLVSALSAGQFPVRWMPDAAFGLGYPFFNYYAARYNSGVLLNLAGYRELATRELATADHLKAVSAPADVYARLSDAVSH